MERDAALRVQLERAHVNVRPAPRRHGQGARFAGPRARHVRADDAGGDDGLEQRRAGGKSRRCRRGPDGMHRARIRAVAASRAQHEELGLARGAGRAEVPPGRDALLGPARDFARDAAQRVPEEVAAVAQKDGSRLTCHRNATRSLRPAGSAAYWKPFIRNGTSNRVVQPRSPMRNAAVRPAPAS